MSLYVLTTLITNSHLLQVVTGSARLSSPTFHIARQDPEIYRQRGLFGIV